MKALECGEMAATNQSGGRGCSPGSFYYYYVVNSKKNRVNPRGGHITVGHRFPSEQRS